MVTQDELHRMISFLIDFNDKCNDGWTKAGVSKMLETYKLPYNTVAVLRDMGHVDKKGNCYFMWTSKYRAFNQYFARKVWEQSLKRTNNQVRAAQVRSAQERQRIKGQVVLDDADMVLQRNAELKQREAELLKRIELDKVKRENDALEQRIKQLEQLVNN